MSLRGSATLNFWATDLPAASAWYTEFLGLEPYFDRPGYVEFRLGDHQAELGSVMYNPHYVDVRDARVS